MESTSKSITFSKSAWLHFQIHASTAALQEWRHVRLSRCEMWAQAVGEIHFLRLHRDDRETERPCALMVVTNSRRQPQSEELACNDNGLEEVIAGDNGAKHLFVAIMWTTLYHFLLDGTLTAAICPCCNIHKWHGFTENLTICLCEKVITVFVSLSLRSGIVTENKHTVSLE